MFRSRRPPRTDPLNEVSLHVSLLCRHLGVSRAQAVKDLEVGQLTLLTPYQLRTLLNLLVVIFGAEQARVLLLKHNPLGLSAGRANAPFTAATLGVTLKQYRSLLRACPELIGMSPEDVREKLALLASLFRLSRSNVLAVVHAEPQILLADIDDLAARVRKLADLFQHTIANTVPLIQTEPSLLTHDMTSMSETFLDLERQLGLTSHEAVILVRANPALLFAEPGMTLRNARLILETARKLKDPRSDARILARRADLLTAGLEVLQDTLRRADKASRTLC